MECFVRKYNVRLNDATLPIVNGIDAELCAHRLGKKMTYTEQSDTFRGGAEEIAEIADAKGIKFGVFWGMSTSSTYRDLALPFVQANQMWIDAYSNPNGASSLDQVTQEDYEAQRDSLFQRIGDWFNIRPVTMSFGYGNTTYADWAIEDFLACRNSGKNGGTPYGVGYGNPNNIAYSKSYFKSKASTSRWYDDAKADSSFATRLQQLSADVISTKQNGGWYNNFTHWHNVIADGNLQVYKDYIDLLASLNTSNDIYFAGYGEAVAYLAYREIVKDVSASIVNNTIIISLTLKSDIEINTTLLAVPVSVRLDVTGTPLEDKTLTCEGGNMVKVKDNEYIVEIPYSESPSCIVKTNN